MGSGASSNRIKLTIDRIAKGLGYETELLATHRTIFILIRDLKTQDDYSSFTKTPPHGANLLLVSGISRMSWKSLEANWTLDQIKDNIKTLEQQPRYSILTTVIFVSLADAAFCRLFGAEHLDMITAFIATAMAFLIKHYTTKLKFNLYLTIAFASFTACLITGAAIKLDIGIHPEIAFNTAVLFLIPGVPLINSFSDLIEGFTMNGIVRGTHAMVVAFSIALGMLASLYLYNI